MIRNKDIWRNYSLHLILFYLFIDLYYRVDRLEICLTYCDEYVHHSLTPPFLISWFAFGICYAIGKLLQSSSKVTVWWIDRLCWYFFFLHLGLFVCREIGRERGGKEMRKFLIVSYSLFYVLDNGVEFSWGEYLRVRYFLSLVHVVLLVFCFPKFIGNLEKL